MPFIKMLHVAFLTLLLLFAAYVPFAASDQKDNVVAVWDLDDLSPFPSGGPNLGELLSGQIIEALQKKADYTVVERERLMMVLGELNLGSSSLVDEATRLKLGKLTGARYMVLGGYMIIADKMRVDIRLVEVETGKVVKALQKTASAPDLQGMMDLIRKAAEEL